MVYSDDAEGSPPPRAVSPCGSKGLVVIMTCGHTGMVDTCVPRWPVFGVAKLHPVVGGFHLAPATPDYTEHTIHESEKLHPGMVLPIQCSGRNFIRAMQRRLPDRLVNPNVGTIFILGNSACRATDTVRRSIAGLARRRSLRYVPTMS